MVTAVLPTISANEEKDELATTEDDQGFSPSITSETTITPDRSQHPTTNLPKYKKSSITPTRLAGAIGLATGSGALVALLLFLRLPFDIEERGVSPSQALRYSYYIVGVVAITLSPTCFFGLRHLRGEDGKGWTKLFGGRVEGTTVSRKSHKLLVAVKLGFKNRSLGLAYLGGLVARASSVGISTFIPLFVNNYYVSSGLCDGNGRDSRNPKEYCRGAYVLSAQLTGISQSAALVFALVFGFSADRWRGSNGALTLAALVGLVGYVALGLLNSPRTSGQDGNPFVFFIMIMLGFSQIGAIVCSLGLLGRCVLGMEANSPQSPDSLDDSSGSGAIDQYEHVSGESAPLILKYEATKTYEDIKGAIAGVSLASKAKVRLFIQCPFSAPQTYSGIETSC